MVSVRSWVVFVALASACNGRGGASQSVESAVSNGASVSTAGARAEPDASVEIVDAASSLAVAADPVESARTRFSMTVAARWPGAAGFGDVIAMAKPGAGANATASLTWVREGEGALVSARSYPLSAQALTGMGAVDVGAEPGDELVVFGDAVDTFGGHAGVFSLPAGREQPLHDGARSAALNDATSVDAVRAMLPLERARTAQERATQSDTAMLGQLVFASVAEVTAAIAARGLQVCAVRAPQGQRRPERCRTFAGRTLTERVVNAEVRERLRHMFESTTTLGYQCERGPEPRCGAQISGGTELYVTLTGAGAERRISKITAVDHEIGE
jgi:hypothetical protein